MGLRVFKAAPVALALVLGISGAAHAQFSDYQSYSQVDPNGGASIVDNGTSSSSAKLDANNYARSFITPGTSIMGATAATDGSTRALTMTTHDDSWWFNCTPTNVCGSLPVGDPIPLELTFGIQVSETQVTNSAYLEFDANYDLQTGGRFNFYFVQDGRGDFELQSTYIDSTGARTHLPVQQTLAGGVWTLTVSATVQDQICGVTSGYSCIPTEMSCDSGTNCSSTPVFTDFQSIKAEIDPSLGESDVIDGWDPFTLKVVSLDPNYQFVSADGRSSTATPEPATWAMLLLGMGMVGLAARRRASPLP
jgi:hypothetical protein